MTSKYKDFEDRTITDREVIKRSIKNILSTPKGTFPANPKFGSDLRTYLFSDLDPLDIMDLKAYVNSVIINNEPRVSNVSTDAVFTPEYHRLVITVYYVINQEEETDFVSLTLNTN